MLSDKLISLLKSFSKNDLTAFGKYLSSPFFNENRDLLALFSIIQKNLRSTASNGLKNKGLEKKEVWKTLFKTKAYNDVYLRRLCSDLTKLGHGYLAYKAFQSAPLLEENQLLSMVNTPKLKKHFDGAVRNIREKQEKSKIRNADFHFNNFQLELKAHHHLEVTGVKIKTMDNLERSDYHLDCFYIMEKLKNYCTLLDYKNIYSIEGDISLFPAFLDFVEQSKYINEPVVKAYFLVSQMLLSEENEQPFEQLKALLEKHYDKFKHKELKELYNYLNNYIISSKINKGREEYYKDLFELFKTQIKHGIVIENGEIHPQDYKNFISVGLNQKAFEWVESFVQNFSQKLPKENQDNNVNYNLAKIYFHQGDYEKVIEQLREVEYKTMVHSLGGKLMLLKTYYELKEFMVLDSLLDSFRIYIQRNRLISRSLKQQYLNMLRFTKKLANTPEYDKKSLEKIKTQITSSKALVAKWWLLEKVAEREK